MSESGSAVGSAAGSAEGVSQAAVREAMGSGVERPLPCGGWTRDFARYKAEWQNVGAAVTSVSGWQLDAFDPDFLFRSERGGQTLVLPVNFVRAVWLRQLDDAKRSLRDASCEASREASS